MSASEWNPELSFSKTHLYSRVLPVLTLETHHMPASDSLASNGVIALHSTLESTG